MLNLNKKKHSVKRIMKILKDNDTIIIIGTFGTYFQDAIRNVQKLVKEKFLDELFNFYDVGVINIKSQTFR